MPFLHLCPLSLSPEHTQEAHLKIFEEAKNFNKFKQSDTVLHDNKNHTPQKPRRAKSIKKLQVLSLLILRDQQPKTTTSTPV